MLNEADFEQLLLRETGSKTGPKGVLADYAYYKAQEEKKLQQTKQELVQQLEATAPSSGWMQRQHQDDEQVYETYRQKRLAELRYATKVQQVEEEELLDLMEKHEKLVILYYEQGRSRSEKVAHMVDQLMQTYRQTKFVRVESDRFEPEALPALLGYQNGQLVANLVFLYEQVPRFQQTGQLTLEDIEDLLNDYSVLQ